MYTHRASAEIDLFQFRLGSYARPFDLTASSSAQLTADKQMLAASRTVYVKKIIKAMYVFQQAAALSAEAMTRRVESTCREISK